MIALGPHIAFILAAYVAAAFIVGGLIFWVALDYSTQRRILGEMEKRGIKRRSQRRGKK